MNRNYFVADPDAFTVSTQTIEDHAWHESSKPATLDEAQVSIGLAAVSGGIVITACDKAGNIYSFRKVRQDKLSTAIRVIDINEISKEGLMSWSADGSNVYAIWLGFNNQKGQRIYGAGAADGGKTWRKKIIV